MRRSPFAIGLFALVLAAMCAATTAFATMDKTIRLDIDGYRTTVRTFSDDVAGALRKAGVELGAHDTVAPDLSAPLRDGSQVIVRRGRLLQLTVDGEPREVWVTALTVEDALDQLGLTDRGAWLSASRSLSIPRQGLSLQLRLPQRVSVLVDGKRRTTTTTAATVQGLLRELNINVHKLDRVRPSVQRYPTDGMVVTVDRVRQRVVKRTLAIPFRTKHVKSSTLYVGDSDISRYGKPGVRVNTYRMTWKNNELVGRKLLSSTVRAHPQTQVVLVGTKARPQYTPSADGLNWPALAQCESGGNPYAVAGPNGEYRGLYQFTISAWQSVGGSGDPIDASSSEQTYRAQLLYRRSGDAAWPTCGQYLYT